MSAALVVLGYMELPKDEVPPEEIWGHDERLQEWFKAVEKARQSGEKMPSQDEEEIPANWLGNELTKDLIGEG